MKSTRKNRQNSAGVALLTATLFLAMAVLVLGALSLRVVNQNAQVNQYVSFRNSFQGLEAALAQSKADLKNGGDGMVGVGSWLPPESDEPMAMLPTFDDDGVAPAQVPTMPNVEYMAYVTDWSGDGIDNNADGTIDGVEESGIFTVSALARSEGIVRQAEVILGGSDVNVWNNAVFAGAGHVSGAVQGNCSIHGSVHILGNIIPEGGDAVVVLDLMGASLIHNNYGIGPGPGPALPDRLRDSVPLLPTTLYNAEIVDTLFASLRVKNGLVSVNSTSEIGQADIPGNRQKETMDGTFNTDGWTGQRTEDDGDRGDPTVVYSDNGWDHTYDLGTQVTMPMLDDDWRWPEDLQAHELGYAYDPVPGTKEVSPDGDWYGHTEFFSDMLSDGDPYVGDVVIENDTDFYLNLTRPDDPNPANRIQADAAGMASGDDYLYFNSATQVLEINGQIEIDGNLEFKVGKSGASEPSIYYSGRAAILAHGDVTINADLFACNNGDKNDYVNSFPRANCLGVMAGNDMVMGESAQLDLMGAFYAQGSVTSEKQTVVLGTFVASWFDMGSQVPDIFQVPVLAKTLPLGMVGNWPIWNMSQISWREVGV